MLQFLSFNQVASLGEHSEKEVYQAALFNSFQEVKEACGGKPLILLERINSKHCEEINKTVMK